MPALPDEILIYEVLPWSDAATACSLILACGRFWARRIELTRAWAEGRAGRNELSVRGVWNELKSASSDFEPYWFFAETTRFILRRGDPSFAQQPLAWFSRIGRALVVRAVLPDYSLSRVESSSFSEGCVIDRAFLTACEWGHVRVVREFLAFYADRRSDWLGERSRRWVARGFVVASISGRIDVILELVNFCDERTIEAAHRWVRGRTAPNSLVERCLEYQLLARKTVAS